MAEETGLGNLLQQLVSME